MQGKSVFISLIVMLLVVAQVTLAQEEVFFLGEETGVGARAMGMGGAFLGVADDYSAIYWNPAGLGQLRRMEMNIGFSHNKYNNKADFLGTSMTGETSFTRLNSIGFVFPVPTYQGSLVFGVGYNKIRDFDTALEISGFNEDYTAYADNVMPIWGDEYATDIYGDLQQDESIIEEGSLNQFTMSGAVEIQKSVLLGASLNFIGGKDDYSLKFIESDIYNFYNTAPYDDSLGYRVLSDLDNWVFDQNIVSDYSATSLKMGVLYQMNRAIRLGATIVFPTQYSINESWSQTITETYDYDDDMYVEEQSGEGVNYKFVEPYTLAVGGSFKLINLLLSGSVEFKDWTQAKFKTDAPSYGVSKSDVNARIKKELQSVTRIRLGAEVYVPVIKARVRAGYYNDPSAYKYTNVTPDKEYLTAGASLMLDKQVMVDFGLTHGSWQRETTDNLTWSPTLEKVTFNKFVGTLSVRF